MVTAYRASRIAIIAALVSLPATAAFAQDANGQSPAQDSSSPSASQSEPAESGIADIVVTAQRREERLQNVPVAVSAVSGAGLEKAGVADMRQLTQSMPALMFSRANSSFQPYIRGVGTRNANTGDESNVAVYIDGVYQPVMSSSGFDLVNIDRVEVLRGPQGTLFGRNSTGGMINVITKEPTEEFSGRFSLKAGSYGQYSGSAYLSSGIMPGLRADIAYMRYTDGGYIKDLLRGGHVGGRDSELVRGRVAIDPTPRFQAVITGSYTSFADGAVGNNQPLFGNTTANNFTPRPVFGTHPWESASERERSASSKQWSIDVQLRNEFNGFNIETTSSYQQARTNATSDNDGSSRAIRGSESPQKLSYLSNEIRVLSTTDGPLSWIGGAYFFSGDARFNPLTSVVAGVPGVPLFSRQTVNSIAGFGEATLRLGNFRFIGGVRYTDEKRTYAARNPTNPSLVPLQRGGGDQITYRATAQYEFNSNFNTYLTYSRGFKSGVFNGFASSIAAARITRPEILDAYEFGIKSDPTSWLRFNLSAFHYDYKDIQQSARDPLVGLVVLFNAAQSTMNGGEVELTVQPVDRLNMRFYATYLDAKYDSFATAQIFRPKFACPVPGQAPCGNVSVAPFDASGKDMIRAPQFTLGASGNYEIPVDFGVFGLSANVFYSDKYYWDFENRISQPAYTLVNAEISYRTSEDDDALSVSLWVKNLLNTVVYSQVLTSAEADTVAFDPPRVFGVTLAKNF